MFDSKFIFWKLRLYIWRISCCFGSDISSLIIGTPRRSGSKIFENRRFLKDIYRLTDLSRWQWPRHPGQRDPSQRESIVDPSSVWPREGWQCCRGQGQGPSLFVCKDGDRPRLRGRGTFPLQPEDTDLSRYHGKFLIYISLRRIPMTTTGRISLTSSPYSLWSRSRPKPMAMRRTPMPTMKKINFLSLSIRFLTLRVNLSCLLPIIKEHDLFMTLSGLS